MLADHLQRRQSGECASGQLVRVSDPGEQADMGNDGIVGSSKLLEADEALVARLLSRRQQALILMPPFKD